MYERFFCPWFVFRKGWFDFRKDALVIWPGCWNTSFIFAEVKLLKYFLQDHLWVTSWLIWCIIIDVWSVSFEIYINDKFFLSVPQACLLCCVLYLIFYVALYLSLFIKYSYCKKYRYSVSINSSRISPIYTSKLGVIMSWSNVENLDYVKCLRNSSVNTNMEVYKDQPSSLNDMVYDFQKIIDLIT